ncbi:hypothetical protein AB4097_16510 [Microvirga sp. 2MCAF35]|uniref:hypothetical protein n=1 Tax=Microvirga sp. 2MCAF35 TaxID=3232987 RepID=UPI003F9807C0
MESDNRRQPKDDLTWSLGSGVHPRSFLFSLDDRYEAPGLGHVLVPIGKLQISPDYHCYTVASQESFLILIGHCIDLRAPASQEPDAARTLLHAALHDGVETMLAASDHIIGRYTVICYSRGTWTVFNDACATRSTYFAEDADLIASHSTLIGRALGREARKELFRHFRYGLPGNVSPVAGVRVVPANFSLDLRSKKLTRFWPIKRRVERTIEELISPLEDVLTRTADAVALRWTPALSLTAGIDSRTTLAAFSHIPSTVPFTYYRGPDDATDIDIASMLCRSARFEHRPLAVVNRSDAPSIYAAADAMVDYKHFDEASAIYFEAFAGGNYIHVRSNLAEIGRAFWRRHPVMPTRFGADNWIDVATHQDRQGEPLRQEAMRYMQDEMAAFIDLAGYDLSDPFNPSLLGYDAWDLVYWEHRMSTWHAQVLMGSDFAFDTQVIFNSRTVLDLLMSAPLKDRAKAALFHQFIDRKRPDFSSIPINPRPSKRGVEALILGAYRRLRRRVPILRSLDRSTNLMARLR